MCYQQQPIDLTQHLFVYVWLAGKINLSCLHSHNHTRQAFASVQTLPFPPVTLSPRQLPPANSATG
jgi:hypothetical protein